MPSRPNSVIPKAFKADARSRTEDWVYAGLSVPSGVVIARPSQRHVLKPGGSVQLIGNEHAAGVGQFLGKLALGRKVSLRFEWQRGMLFEHWFRPEKVDQLLRRKPDVLVFLFDTKVTEPEPLVAKLRELLRAAKSVPVRWVLPLEDNPSSALRLALPAVGVEALRSYMLPVHRSQTGAPSARGYAGWAGAIWNWIR